MPTIHYPRRPSPRSPRRPQAFPHGPVMPSGAFHTHTLFDTYRPTLAQPSLSLVLILHPQPCAPPHSCALLRPLYPDAVQGILRPPWPWGGGGSFLWAVIDLYSRGAAAAPTPPSRVGLGRPVHHAPAALFLLRGGHSAIHSPENAKVRLSFIPAGPLTPAGHSRSPHGAARSGRCEASSAATHPARLSPARCLVCHSFYGEKHVNLRVA